jgi:hypothetical protein
VLPSLLRIHFDTTVKNVDVAQTKQI